MEGMGRASAESEQDQAGVLDVLSGASCLRWGQPEVEEVDCEPLVGSGLTFCAVESHLPPARAGTTQEQNYPWTSTRKWACHLPGLPLHRQFPSSIGAEFW